MGAVFFSGRVLLEWDPGAVEFIVQAPLTVTWMVEGEQKVKFTILPGFKTDLGSGMVQVARHLRGDLAHDWLYEYHEGLTKSEVDQLWLDAMRDDDTSWWRRRVRYRYVVLSPTARRRWEDTPTSRLNDGEDDEEDFND